MLADSPTYTYEKDKLIVTLGVHCSNDYADEVPDRAVVTLDKGLINRIVMLNDTVKTLGVREIVDYDSPEWKQTDWELDPETLVDSEARLDLEGMEVGSSIVSWHAYFKHSDIRINTDSLYLEDILELQKVYSAPKRDIPTLINEMKTERGKEALKARLS